ncbi:MAG TPA: molybdopterin-synthase adenylyltransferase MoeB [Chryseosolibacter sp.]
MLSVEELKRYQRHIIIPEFGIACQEKLKAAKVLVVGSGGLGNPLSLYLAAAGVGTIGIVDGDVVEETNLQRQILYNTDDIGSNKVETAKKKLRALNPFIDVIVLNTWLTRANAMEIIADFDIVADGTDNFATRYLVNDACVFLGKANVYASIFQFEGQVSVFNHKDLNSDERGPNYRDLYPSPPPPDLVPSCAVGGVLGVLPGIIGSLQALEVIKIITGIGETLSGRLFTFDALTFETRTFSVRKDPSNPLTGEHPTIRELIDYNEFCQVQTETPVKEISAEEFDKIRSSDEVQLIDVREPEEYSIFNVGGQLIPLKDIPDNYEAISRDKKVVVYCKSGGRSKKAIRLLQDKYGFDNLYNLKGGLMEYVERIEPSLATHFFV